LISIDLDKILLFLKQIIPYEYYSLICNSLIKTTQVVKVQVKIILLSSIQTIIGLYILGISNSLTIGLICGILDLFPIIGPGLIFIPWIIYELLVKNIFTSFGLLFLYILILISRQILEVKLMQNNLRIHPVTIIFSLYIGMLIYDFWGIIIGPIIIVLFKELFNKTYEGRRVYNR
jgi:predicted PurR-regulated permease PerM